MNRETSHIATVFLARKYMRALFSLTLSQVTIKDKAAARATQLSASIRAAFTIVRPLSIFLSFSVCRLHHRAPAPPPPLAISDS